MSEGDVQPPPIGMATGDNASLSRVETILFSLAVLGMVVPSLVAVPNRVAHSSARD